MTEFKTARPGPLRFILLELLKSAVSLCLVSLIIKWVKPSTVTTGSVITIIIGFLLVDLLRHLQEYRLFKLIFDDEQRELVFFVKHTFAGRQRKTLSYDRVRLQLTGRVASPMLLFFNDGQLMFKVNKYKDGFSAATIDAVCANAQQRSLLVKKVKK